MRASELTDPAATAARSGGLRILLIVNADASRVSLRSREGVLGALGARHHVDAVFPRSGEEATTLCRMEAAGHDLVVAFGGDGTVSAAGRGMLGTGIPLACVPGGFTNVIARTLGMPRDPVAAAHRIASMPRGASPRAVSLGTLDGRPFLFAAGAGFSAALMERLREAGALKSGFGTAYAAWHVGALVASSLAGNLPALAVDAGGRELQAVAAMAQNSDPLTFLGPRPIRISPAAGLETPGLALTALRSAPVRDVLPILAAAVAGRPGAIVARPRVEHWPSLREARISSLDREGVPVEIDGDYLGRRPSVALGVTSAKLLLAA